MITAILPVIHMERQANRGFGESYVERRRDGTFIHLNKSDKTRHITLIDPAKQDPEIAANRAMVAVECGSKMIFVGGSTDTPDEIVHATCVAIQESLELRVFAASQDPTGDEESWKIQ